ncbi:RNA 3'-terminal phosphate cyclase [Maniola jurtina]|uniref:RNA 3'-terminal phosphate cyclase n=1 Tax=Maniola jurtina TaxID=191418 RepID=UPI001E6891A7|nr:RNA 3'-terminal phosphate cyclase [Maniola jurtina]XP_045777377.1 RNA 3'-terminal phosphate cyclase [Maniola jurtina]
MSQILEIDGSVLEGGGQILRISISLSAILGVPVRVINIRAGRSKPGLAAQHLKGIELVADMCQAKLRGASIGSTEIEFIPGKIKGGHYVADTKTAGSISLLLQVALPCALFADSPVTLDLKGGTNADMAPQIDYMERVFRLALRHFGADFNMTILRRGYFPKGGGHVRVEVSPVRSLRSINLTERGTVKEITGTSFVAGTLPIKLAYLMVDGARRELGCDAQIHCYQEDRQMAPHNCNGIILSSTLSSGCVLGSDALGKRGVDATDVGRKAGEELRRALDSGACVDPHTQDQLILYMTLAEGRSVVRAGDVTLHTKTAIHIAQIIAKVQFSIQLEGDHNFIECTGLGLINKNIPQE